ncbi:MAG: cupredoxin family copper-binding protein [Candidatus Competibacter sp.]
MIASFFKSAAPGIPQRLGETYYSAALIHAAARPRHAALRHVCDAARQQAGAQGAALQELQAVYAHGLRSLHPGDPAGPVGLLRPGTPTLEPAEAGAQVQPVAQGPNQLTLPMVNFVFNPTDVTIPVGTTVIWVNQDGAPHTATADDGAAFKSDLLSKGQSFSHTFDKVGDFPYFCELHGSAGGQDMAGTIKVVPADQAPPLVAAAPAGRRAHAPAHAQPAAGQVLWSAERHGRLPRRQGPQRPGGGACDRRHAPAGRPGAVRLPDHARRQRDPERSAS